MTAARSSWKRLHSDQDDCNECMSASKRKRSFHAESQDQELSSENGHGAHVRLLDDPCDNSGMLFPTGTQHSPVTSQPVGSCGNDLNIGLDLANNNEGSSNSSEVKQKSISCRPVPHLCHSLSDPHPLHSSQQHRLAATFCQSHSQNVEGASSHCQPLVQNQLEHGNPLRFYDLHNHYGETISPQFGRSHYTHGSSLSESFSSASALAYNQPLPQFHTGVPFSEIPLQSDHVSAFHYVQSQQAPHVISNENDQASIDHRIQGGIHHGFHSPPQNDSSESQTQESMPDYSNKFQLQQLPSGNYDPELGMDENPYYFSINRMLYEAHFDRVTRESGFSK